MFTVCSRTMQYSLFTFQSSIEEIHDRLGRSFGPLLPHDRLDPVSQLIRSLIGAQTRARNSEQAFNDLRERLYPWEALLFASDAVLLGCLRPVTYAERKAPQLRGAMQMIKGWVGTIGLDFLGDRPVEDAQVWLRRLPGVDMKVSAAVLNFSTLQRRVLVVDTHHFRVAKRLGLVRANTRFAAAQQVLMSQHIPIHWTADDLGEHHALMKRLGQTWCRDPRPLCGMCPLRDSAPQDQGGGSH
jgi:endonuclease-3